MSKYRVRKIKTASGATAVQVVCYENNKRKIEKHIGSAKDQDEITVLLAQAQQFINDNEPQLFLFQEKLERIVLFDQIEATGISHKFIRNVLHAVTEECGLNAVHTLYRDLAIMRIIEPCSKLRSIQLIAQHFGVSYTQYLYELLPKILIEQPVIEAAAIKTALTLESTFTFVLYDVTTLYFETHKPNDELQARGFSKDDKSKQPQIVIGLLVTAQGFPLAHRVFKGNTFEGHTMLNVVKDFQEQYGTEKPIIVADAAMLSRDNLTVLETEGYCYIVGARLANMNGSFVQSLCHALPREEHALLRMSHPGMPYDVVCSYSTTRYKKEKREFDKQVEKAKDLIARKEAGKRAKFIKRSLDKTNPYLFNEELKKKSEYLLGIKGYCTNIPEKTCSNKQIISYYHDLWRVEQAFRISKHDLKARPIFHHTHDAIRAHMLICFISLMTAKFVEIKTGSSIRTVKDLLWQVHEVTLHDPFTKMERIVRTPISQQIKKILKSLNVKIPH